MKIQFLRQGAILAPAPKLIFQHPGFSHETGPCAKCFGLPQEAPLTPGGNTVPLRFYQSEPHQALVKLEGNFDSDTAPEIRKSLIKIVKNKGVESLEIDFSEVPNLGTAGVAVLVEVLRAMTRKGGALNLVGLNDNARQMIRLARLGEIFET
jgi:anti-sigma B factor antagonist